MVEKKYSVDVTTIQQLDIYDVCELFAIDDSSGALQHAIKKLLRAGKGHKPMHQDIKEAHWTLGRWLDNNKTLGQWLDDNKPED